MIVEQPGKDPRANGSGSKNRNAAPVRRAAVLTVHPFKDGSPEGRK
jgi:hypothetical protein